MSIIHIDMDCFYAAIEVRDRPELRGEPVAVGGRSSRRGVLTTCNYKAREFGLRSAMPTFQALQKCPHLIVLPVRFEAYRRESRHIHEIFREYTELIEPLSLDEAFLDVSHLPKAPAAIARAIRKEILQKTGLTASAGIAPNKMLAKIASDWNKPNGQFEIKPKEVNRFMESLPVSKIWGVGKKAEAKLHGMCIETCGQLQACSRLDLQATFGKFGGELFELCRGIDDRTVETRRIRKSLSTERTFARNLETLEDCQQTAAEIFDELLSDLSRVKDERPISKIFVKLKFSDFTRSTIERTGISCALPNFLDLLAECYRKRPDPVRLIGLGVRFVDPDRQRHRQLEFDFG